MTLKELKKILDSTGYPVAYSHFNEYKKTPYITYLVSDSPNYFADNTAYKKIDSVQIELYTDKKDIHAEEKLEKILDDNNICYTSSETYIESQGLFQKIYEMEMMK